MNRLAEFDVRYLKFAHAVAQKSKDPSTKTGTVIVSDSGSVLAYGFNDFAKGVLDSPERWDRRELKYKLVVHAEINAIAIARRDLSGATAYMWPWMPCTPCAGALVQSGIRRCVAPENDNERWAEDFQLTRQVFSEAGVELVEVASTLLAELV